jgi:hypothetical protein
MKWWCGIKKVFYKQGGFGMMLPTLEDIIGFRNSTFDVVQNNNGGSRVD